ncbi:MAG: aldehyde ferredoxin oxidoreductase family protein [Spirochaetota bacterium]
MITETGVSFHYLVINLAKQSWEVLRLPEKVQRNFIGGKGVGLKLYYDRVRDLSAVDPFGPENLLCFMTSPLLASGAPCSARFEGITKSPLTGVMTASSCGGEFGEACKTAGWDGIVLEGISPEPVVVTVHYEGVEFAPAQQLWGMTTSAVQSALGLGVKDGALVIGPAGEHLVPYANICSGHRFLGRGGMGAVMGAKRVKALVAHGREYAVKPADPLKFEQVKRRSRKYVERNAFTQQYRSYGTNANMRYAMHGHFAPVENFQRRTDKRIDYLTGQRLNERYRARFSSCRHCAILCGHKGTYPDGVQRQIPEYETTGMFGANIGNYNPDIIGQWNDVMNDLGLDTISTGGTIAWAMEASQKGLFPCELAFGRADNIETVIRQIAYREGIGAQLAEGSRSLSETYGGREFACQVKGMEMAAYDPRGSWGQGLSYAVANRGGCHLASYLVGPETLFKLLNPHTTRSKAFWAVFFENIFSGINSLETCQFMAFSVLLEPFIARITPPSILRFAMTNTPSLAKRLIDWSILSDFYSAVTGYRVSQQDFYTAGERIQVLERHINIQMGLTPEEDTLPQRFLSDGSEGDEGVDLAPMLKQYYHLRGYDQQGVPTEETLKRLELV